MCNFRSNPHIYCLALMFSSVLMAQVPDHERASIDQIIGRQGAYVADDGVHRITLPREAATIVNDDQSLSPNIGLNSWVAFKSAVHDQAILTGQMLLLEDEVDTIVAKALDSGLEVTGLASSSVFNGPRLQTIDVAGVGSYQRLASAFRECLNEIGHVRRASLHSSSCTFGAKGRRQSSPEQSDTC